MARGAPALPVLGIMGREGQRFPPRAMSMGVIVFGGLNRGLPQANSRNGNTLLA